MSVEETPLTPAQIYGKITGGPGLDSLRDSQDTLSDLQRLMESSAADVQALNSKISEGFQGNAADAAANATKPLSKATDDDLDHLTNVGDSISAQMTAFSSVTNSVQPVAAQPPAMTKQDFISYLNGDGDTYGQKVGQWAATGQANIQAFGAYHQASTANGQTAPSQFGQVVDPGENVTMAGTSTAKASTPTTSSAKTSKTSGSVGYSAGLPQTIGAAAQPAVTSVPNPAPATPTANPTWNDGTSAAAYTPSAGNLPEGYQFGPTGSLDPRANPNITGNYGTNSGNPGFGGYYAGGTGAPGSGSGYRGGGYGSGEPGQAGGRGSLGAGRSTGAGPLSENAPTGSGRGGTTGNTGKAGQSGMPGIGPGGKKDEDKERKRPDYLRNPDPDSTFADPVPKTTPPVIGER